MTSTDRRYVVVGAGAVGVGLAAGLQDAGIPVVLVSRGATYAAIARGGLRYSQGGVTRVLDVPVVDGPDGVALRPGDVLVLAVKSQDAPATLADWAWRPVEGDLSASDLPLVLTQNGLAAERVAARYFGTVVAGVTLLAGRHVVPGEVAIGNAPRTGQLILGAYPSAAGNPRSNAVAESVSADLTRANWLSQPVAEIDRWLAWKLLTAVTFALSVLDGAPDEKQVLREQVVAEARTVLQAARYEIADPRTELDYDAAQAAVEPGYGGHEPSTWQSFERGSSSEVDFLNGEIVLLGRLHGVPTPFNEALQRVLGRSAARAERPNAHHVAEVLALRTEASSPVTTADLQSARPGVGGPTASATESRHPANEGAFR